METVLLVELFFSLALKWGMAVCSGASVSSAYYLTECTDPCHVRNVKKSKAFWVRALCDTNEPILVFCDGGQVHICVAYKAVTTDGG